MAHRTQKPKSADAPQRIGLNEEREIRYWTQCLSCTEEELRRAVESVGMSAYDVKKYFYA
jgi:hypothetical protein